MGTPAPDSQNLLRQSRFWVLSLLFVIFYPSCHLTAFMLAFNQEYEEGNQ